MRTPLISWAIPAITLLGLVTFIIAFPSKAGGPPVDSMVGAWEGKAQIIVSWCPQKYLSLSLKISADGTVSGKVGDATLVKGRIRRNRGALGRFFDVKTDYIISGRLQGPIIASSEITRKSVTIPLNFNGSQFSGGLHTSGKPAGGKTSVKLSATSLTLTRSGDPM